MTTTMGGSDWDIPFAPFREIYSNAIDEDADVVLDKSNEPIGRNGYTTIYIECTEAMNDFYRNFDEYFCNKNPNVLETNDSATIYPKTNNGTIKLFRSGILCYDGDEKSIFSYNSKHFLINESRVLSAEFSAKIDIAQCLKKCKNKEVIRDLLDSLEGGNTGYYEHTLPFHVVASFSQEWFDICKDKKFVPVEAVMFCKDSQLIGRIVLPKSLLVPLYRQFEELDILGLKDKEDDVDVIVDDNPNEYLLDKVVDALALLQETRYKVRLKNIDIVYCTFTKNGVLGMAKNGQIFLSTKLEDDDVAYIAKIIIEENEHNITGFGDKTRDFQNHLFKLYFDILTHS
jgi:hypothetical protein